MTGRESHRHVIEARATNPAGDTGICTLLVRRVGEHVELLYHAALSTGARLSDEQATELARYLTEASRG